MGGRETPPEQVKSLKRLAGDQEALWLLPSIRPKSEVHVGSRVPGRPCVDCHAFEFMQRALQDLKKTAYNLDTRVCISIEMLLVSLYLQAARSACLCTADTTSLLTHFHFSK
uniref:NELL2-interacting cell ontogeny regulator 1 n=1 Tax=Strix occidentalis caurina TaxID=311401 RepID=A0A8D0EN42_STROC